MSRDLLIFIFASCICSCTTTGPYHANNSIKNNNPNNPYYRLAFIEFGEQGSYLDVHQLKKAVELVETTKEKVALFIYVHGWHNNAASKDVDRFKKFLAGIASSDQVKNAKFKVIGVYLGWRGERLAIPVLNSLTIWDRKTAAERMANNFDCINAIYQLSATARKRGQKNNFVVLMGHSLGGLVVERAIAHSIATAMYQPHQRIKLPADLIFTLNPASDSILTRELVATLNDLFKYDPNGTYTGDSKYNYRAYDSERDGFPGNRQLIVALAAKNDRANGYTFPLGMSLAQLGKVFPQVISPSSRKMTSEKDYYLSTPGNKSDLITHDVEKIGPIEAKDAEFSNAIEANLSDPHLDISHGHFFTSNINPVMPKTTHPPAAPKIDATVHESRGKLKAGKNVLWKEWKLTPRNNARTPYWIVQVPAEIINDHNGIWDPNSQALMAAIFRMNFPIERKPGFAPPEEIKFPATRIHWQGIGPAAVAAPTAPVSQRPEFSAGQPPRP